VPPDLSVAHINFDELEVMAAALSQELRFGPLIRVRVGFNHFSGLGVKGVHFEP
jgi:hypothetical protein